MNKIILNNCNITAFSKLLNRISAIDSYVVFTIEGARAEAFSVVDTHSVIKYTITDFSKYCGDGDYSNPIKDKVIVAFTQIPKIVACLQLLTTETCTLSFDINDRNYCHKLSIKSDKIKINIPCAEEQNINMKVQSLNMPVFMSNEIYDRTIGNEDGFIYDFSIDVKTFKQTMNLFNIDKSSVNIYFSSNKNNIFVSEIDECNGESYTDIVNNNDIDSFDSIEKIYSQQIASSEIDIKDSIKLIRKKFFKYINNNDEKYTITMFDNRIKVESTEPQYGTTDYILIALG